MLGSVADKVTLAFELFALDGGAGSLTRAEMKKCLNAMNIVASYFGDPVLTTDEIELVVLDAFGSSSVSSAVIGKCVDVIAKHELTDKFVSGRGTVRFGR